MRDCAHEFLQELGIHMPHVSIPRIHRIFLQQLLQVLIELCRLNRRKLAIILNQQLLLDVAENMWVVVTYYSESGPCIAELAFLVLDCHQSMEFLDAYLVRLELDPLVDLRYERFDH